MKALIGYLALLGTIGSLLGQIPPPPAGTPTSLQVIYYLKYLGAAISGGALLHASPQLLAAKE